jgi:hypothetical protein
MGGGWRKSKNKNRAGEKGKTICALEKLGGKIRAETFQ